MLEYELSETNEPNSKKILLEKVRNQISVINDLQSQAKEHERNHADIFYPIFHTANTIVSPLIGGLYTYLTNLQIVSTSLASIVIGSILGYIIIGFPTAIFGHYKIGSLLLKKNTDKFNQQILQHDTELLSLLNNIDIKRAVISELQEIAQLIKKENNNTEFEETFSKLITYLSKDDYESFKNYLLKQFSSWEKIKKNLIDKKNQKENENAFLKSIDLKPSENLTDKVVHKELKSIL